MSHSRPFAIDAVRRLVAPGSVAILGVSGRPDALFRPGGRLLMSYLLRNGYDGPVYPVNPRVESIDGLTAYATAGAIPGPVDCAVVALPAQLVPDAVDDCGAAGIGQALLLGAGFGELGGEGRRLEERTRRVAAEHGIRLLGPNSAGLVNVAGSVALSMTSVLGDDEPLVAGRVALILHSGAMGSSMLDRMRMHGAGVSFMVSLGNQIDLDASDFLAYASGDDGTSAVCVYVEGIADGPRFRESLSMVERAGKRAFVLLAGRSDLGEQAAATHTGRIAGRRALEESLVVAAGATRVDDLDTLWRAADLASKHPTGIGGGRIGILTISGGLGVLTADGLGLAGGFDLPAPSPATRERLSDLVPDYAGITNPLDLGSGTMPDAFLPALMTFGSDDAFDAVAVVLPVVAPWWQETVAEAIVRASHGLGKPVVVCWCAGASNRLALDLLADAGVPVVPTPDDLTRLLAVHRRGPTPPAGSFASEAAAVTVDAGPGVLRRLAAAGCDIPSMEIVPIDGDAVAAFHRVGEPVAVKGVGSRLAHKSDARLVEIGIEDSNGVAAAHTSIIGRARAAGISLDGVLVQAMAPYGVEIVLAVRRDPDLGEFAGVGAGGTLVELLGGVRFAPLPLTADDLERLLRQSPGGSLLLGYRGSAPVDLGWILTALDAMARTAREAGASEIEVNPAIVGPDGGVVVDAVMVLASG